jgi:acetamidase/formamidase
MAVHHLDTSPETVTDVFSGATPPVLTVDPGDRVVVHTLDTQVANQVWGVHAALPEQAVLNVPAPDNSEPGRFATPE